MVVLVELWSSSPFDRHSVTSSDFPYLPFVPFIATKKSQEVVELLDYCCSTERLSNSLCGPSESDNCLRYEKVIRQAQNKKWWTCLFVLEMDLLSLPKCPTSVPTHSQSPSNVHGSSNSGDKPKSVLTCLSAAIPAVTDPALKMSTNFLNAVSFFFPWPL